MDDADWKLPPDGDTDRLCTGGLDSDAIDSDGIDFGALDFGALDSGALDSGALGIHRRCATAGPRWASLPGAGEITSGFAGCE